MRLPDTSEDQSRCTSRCGATYKPKVLEFSLTTPIRDYIAMLSMEAGPWGIYMIADLGHSQQMLEV